MVWGLAEQTARGLGPPRGHLCPPAQVLDLSHNELSFVPPDLPEALEELHLQNNRISYVGPQAFISTPGLRALFLRCPEGGWVGSGGQGRALVDCGGPQQTQRGDQDCCGPLPLYLPSYPPLGPGPTGFT